ncbi:hypothetical protein VTJ49DRAFT_7671 [Mycothermus thermophilus]|uniref:NACHT domain-containing protein n=1 Tax=Humicola insolens TaxID=85995 RepID=A0ABR3VG85_HUMIN
MEEKEIPVAFERALKKLCGDDPLLRRQFSNCTLRDLQNTIADIQLQQGPTGKLRYLGRLEAFVEAMEQFGKVVEVFLNSSEILCFVWGPLKFMLGIARTHVDSLNKLIDMYSWIGDAIPGLLQYKSTFERHEALRTILDDYYYDVLVFHRKALDVFARPKWKELLRSVWKTFDSSFGPILDSLKRRREMLESAKSTVTLHEIQTMQENIALIRQDHEKRVAQAELDQHRKRLEEIQQKLQSPDYKSDQLSSTNVRWTSGGSFGKWFFEHDDFKTWMSRESPGSRVLFVHGKPGAGKTTLMSAVLEWLQNQKAELRDSNCAMAYFYFNNQPRKQSHHDFLLALLDQLITEDAALSTELLEEFVAIDPSQLSTDRLQGYAKTALSAYRTLYLLVDGADECPNTEAVRLIKWLLSLIQPAADGPGPSVRILVSGRRDGVLDDILKNKPDICLDASPSHSDDIRNFCSEMAEEIQNELGIPDALKKDIVSQPLGMFLYAKVVMQHLQQQPTLRSLKEELQDGYPSDVNKAYDRVFSWILHQPSTKRDASLKLLNWVVCAKRILFWKEIQAMCCINPEQGTVAFDDRLLFSCKKLLHSTARRYLSQQDKIDVERGNTDLAILCLKHLVSRPFTIIHDNQTLSHAKRGYYAFLDYSVQCWYGHLLQWANSANPPEPHIIAPLGGRFLQYYGLASTIGRHFDDSVTPEDLIAFIRGLPGDEIERYSFFSIERRTGAIRQHIESLRHEIPEPGAKEVLDNLYGSWLTYKCTKPWCLSFLEGMETEELRQKHLVDDAVLLVACDAKSVPMVELVLSTGRPQITTSKPITCILKKASSPALPGDPIVAIVLTILRSPNLQLLDSDLEPCRELALSKGLSEVVAALDKALERRKDFEYRDDVIVLVEEDFLDELASFDDNVIGNHEPTWPIRRGEFVSSDDAEDSTGGNKDTFSPFDFPMDKLPRIHPATRTSQPLPSIRSLLGGIPPAESNHARGSHPGVPSPPRIDPDSFTSSELPWPLPPLPPSTPPQN